MGCPGSKQKYSKNTTEGEITGQTKQAPLEEIDMKNINKSTERTCQVETYSNISEETDPVQTISMHGKRANASENSNRKRGPEDRTDEKSKTKKGKKGKSAKYETTQDKTAKLTVPTARNTIAMHEERSKSRTEKSAAIANDETEAFRQTSFHSAEPLGHIQTNQTQRDENVNMVVAVEQPKQNTVPGVKEPSDKQSNKMKKENAAEKQIDRNNQGNASQTETGGLATRQFRENASDQRNNEAKVKQFDGKGQDSINGVRQEQESEKNQKQIDNHQNKHNAADGISFREKEVQTESNEDLQKEKEALKHAVHEKEEKLKKLIDELEAKDRHHKKQIKELEDEITQTQERADKTIRSKSEHKSTNDSKEIANLKRQITDITTEKEKMHQETLDIQSKMDAMQKAKDAAVDKKNKEIRTLEHEKDELLLRLSEMAGRRLTDNNPNIADLSDFNRPTKLAEKYTELYDNEWTDAYSYLENLDAYKGPETTVITALMRMLTMAYKISLESAENQLEALRNNLNDFHGNIPTQDQHNTTQDQQVKDVLKQLKDQRKRVVQPSQDLTAKYRREIEKAFPKLGSTLFETSALKPYLQKCLQLCWLMVIQDPPVHLECEGTKKRETFDKNKFKEYTQAGPFIIYTVWPAVFLEKDGPLLCKGVVQCTKTFSDSCHAPARKIDVDVNRKSSSVRVPGAQSLTIPAKVATRDNLDGGTTVVTENDHLEKRNSRSAKNSDNTDVQTQKTKKHFTEKL